jgi:beta-glucosidase
MPLATMLAALAVSLAASAQQQVAIGGAETDAGTRAAQVPTDVTLVNAPYRDVALPVEQRVADLFGRLTPAEKAALVHGCSGMGFGKIPRIGLPEILMTDGPQGVRLDRGTATAMPCGLAMAATWNPELVQQGGAVMGEECRGLSRSVFLAPGVNILRTPLGGRNFEYMGEDPLLAGKTAAAYIRGVQSQGVAACVKHWNLNEQEHWRTTINVEADNRALEEIYSPAFEIAVREGKVWSVMPAYNKFRGVYCAASKALNLDLFRNQFGFDGAFISDWGAWHGDTDCLNGGCTIAMPSGQDAKHDAAIVAKVASGEISPILFDEAVRRNLRLLFRVGAFDAVQSGAVNSPAHQQCARGAAAEAIVLLQNRHNLLPLDATKIRKLAVVGPNANQFQTMADGSGLAVRGGSGASRPPYEVTPLAALQQRFGDKIIFAPGLEFESSGLNPVPSTAFPEGLSAEFFQNQDCTGTPAATRRDAGMDFHFNPGSPLPAGIKAASFSARWTGLIRAPEKGDYQLSLASDDGSRLWLNDQLIIDNSGDHDTTAKAAAIRLDPASPARLRVEYANHGGKGDVRLGWQKISVADPTAEALAAAAAADAVVFFAGTDHRYDREALGWGDVKGADKPDLGLIGPQAELIRKLAGVNKNLIVVLISGAPVSLEEWQDKVPAILEAWYGGMEAGNAIADVLTGAVNPSGKLPCTFGKKLEDWPAHKLGAEAFPGTGNNGVVKYLDGIWVGYRGFDHAGIAPRFPFGFGLSYTTFKFGKAKLSSGEFCGDDTLTVTVPVTNTGKRAGAEVVQLYVHEDKPTVPRPPQELKGFQKVFLQPGETKTVQLTLTRRDFSFWDVATDSWKADAGTFEIRLGDSSRDLPERAVVKIILNP